MPEFIIRHLPLSVQRASGIIRCETVSFIYISIREGLSTLSLSNTALLVRKVIIKLTRRREEGRRIYKGGIRDEEIVGRACRSYS